MHPITRPLLALAAILAAAVALVACGGDGGGGASASRADVDTLLARTFSGDTQVDSGRVDLSLKLDMAGPVDLRLSGPFERQKQGELPKFDFEIAASGRGQSLRGGLENTGDKGFVTLNGTHYALSAQQYARFRQLGEACARTGNDRQWSFTSLGLDPRKWLRKPRKSGEAKVGGVAVVVITGGLDVRRFLDDVDAAAAKVGSAGCGGGRTTPMTAQQRDRIVRSVKHVDVQIATGKDDSILRRMKVDLRAQDPAGGPDKATVAFDLRLLDLNGDQRFPEPSGAKPFAELLSQFGASALGALSGGAGSGSPAGRATPRALQRYTDCLQRAGSDSAKAQACADLLRP